jgi:hypothetical protein
VLPEGEAEGLLPQAESLFFGKKVCLLALYPDEGKGVKDYLLSLKCPEGLAPQITELKDDTL